MCNNQCITDQNIVEEAAKLLSIPNIDDIRGNITLIDSIETTSVEWKSEFPEVISDTFKDGKVAGVVTRGDSDKKVKLTATITKGTAKVKKTFETTVRKAPKYLKDEDFTAYLFGSFTGTEKYQTDEQIYFATSEDGLYYKDLNNSKPVLESNVGEKGVRDPYIIRSVEGDKFFLIATDLSIYHRGGWDVAKANTTGSRSLVIWESTDLVNWSDARMVEVAVEDAGCAWAPEAIYNDKTGEYVVFFASSRVENGNMKGNMCIYAACTRDFVNFSETKEYIVSPGKNIIDTTMIKAEDGFYYRASKDGENDDMTGGIRVDRSDDIFGEWETILNLCDLGFERDMTNRTLEGPELFKFNKKDWYNGQLTYGLFTDKYMEGTGYLPLITTDLMDVDNSNSSWKLLSEGEYSFDKLKKRHGTIFNITREEYERINEAYRND